MSHATTHAVVPFPAPVGPVGKYTDEDLQKTVQMAIQLSLKLFVQGWQQFQTALSASKLREKTPKAWTLDVYYSNFAHGLLLVLAAIRRLF